MRKFIYPAVLLAALLSFGLFYVANLMKSVAQAYIYLYPLVLTELTRESMVESKGYPLNNFRHEQLFPDHTFRNVVKPNNDTLYSTAWLDLSLEPLVLDVPDMEDRQYVIPFMDAWTNVFATVGTGSTGSQSGSYVLVGPSWQGSSTWVLNGAEVPVITSPTNKVWVIGRIRTHGRHDIVNIARLQKAFSLTRLTDWQNGQRQSGVFSRSKKDTPGPSPYEQLNALSASEFFTFAATMLLSQSTLPEDVEAVENLRELGIVPGEALAIDTWGKVKQQLLDKVIRFTHVALLERIAQERSLENGWSISREGIGVYGTNYGLRAAVAMVGLGALPPGESVYPTAKVDNDGERLNGLHRYKLHFASGQIPPVDAFWSLTMYDEQNFLIDNPIQRYSISDHDRLQFNEDGSLDIYIQQSQPDNVANWLPAPKGDFELTLRLYLPKDEVLDGSWSLPAIVKL